MSVQTSYTDAMQIGFAGMPADGHPVNTLAMRSGEASAEVPFGVAVAFEGSTDDQGALLPAAITDVVAGIVLHSHSYAKPGQLGDTGIKSGEMFDVIRKGRVLVACEDGCSPGDRLHIRAVAAGAEQAGALRASADSTDTIDSTNQGQWLTTAAAGALAWLEVDFTGSAT